MPENKKHSILDPEDDAPDLSTPEWKEKFAGIQWTRGRPKLENPKILTSLRLDPDVLAFFQRSGPGWRTRINDTLRAAMSGRAVVKKAGAKIAAAKRAQAAAKKVPARKRA
jgi:uncharacterized protein (DUF4415 family)